MKITAIKTNNKTGGYVNISFIPKVEKQMKLVNHTMRKVWIKQIYERL
jgi:hypothetical protein